MLLDHPKRNTRDTQKYKPFKKIVKVVTIFEHTSNRDFIELLIDVNLNVENVCLAISHAQSGRPSLRVLCREILNVKVQQGEHSSVCTSLVLL